MSTESQLREKLRKIEALFAGADPRKKSRWVRALQYLASEYHYANSKVYPSQWWAGRVRAVGLTGKPQAETARRRLERLASNKAAGWMVMSPAATVQ